jgi:hypothetical protein
MAKCDLACNCPHKLTKRGYFMKNVLMASCLVLVLTNAFAQPSFGVGIGGSLYKWNNGTFGDYVKSEETLLTACHKDGSLTLTRETRFSAYASRGSVTRSTVRVSVGDIFLLYDKNGQSSPVTLRGVNKCVGDFQR